MHNLRLERANSEIAKSVSQILQTKINNPKLKEFITVTNAKVTPDFRHCKIFVSVLTGDSKEIIKLLAKSEGFIKHELMEDLKLPFTPKLVFILDEGANHSEKINKILSGLNIPQEEDNEENN